MYRVAGVGEEWQGEAFGGGEDLGGRVEVGEMAVREEARGLLLPTAIFARWVRD